MHEFHLINDLIHRVTTLAAEQGAGRVTRVRLWLGALAHIEAAHLREHFEHAAHGTVAEGARLDIDVSDDPAHPDAQSIRLVELDVA